MINNNKRHLEFLKLDLVEFSYHGLKDLFVWLKFNLFTINQR